MMNVTGTTQKSRYRLNEKVASFLQYAKKNGDVNINPQAIEWIAIWKNRFFLH